MLRTALILALCAATAAALETSLTIQLGTTSKVILIDPAYGSMTIYNPSATKTERMGLGKPAANFVADIDLGLKSYLAERDGVPFQAVRVGTLTTKPGYGEMFTGGKWLLDKPTAKEAAAGKAALQTRALRAEDAFWKAEPAYDGVVRAASSSSGRYLALAVPSLHLLMIYNLDNETPTLAAMRNWGPELFMTGHNTAPNPAGFLRELPADKQDQARAALGLDDQPAPGGAAAPALVAEEPPTPKSEAWIAAGPQDSFLVVDVANRRAMLYGWAGRSLDLRAVRNLAVDLVVPGLIGGAWKSDPSGQRLLDDALRTRRSQIETYDLPKDRDELMLLVQQSAAKGKVSPFEGILVQTNPGIATLNFVEARTMLVLETGGGQSLNLVAARDYTLDLAVAMLDKEIYNRASARRLVNEAATLAGSGSPTAALLTLRLALGLDPRLHKDAETRMKSSFRRNVEAQAQFQALLDEAVKQTEALNKQAEERRKTLEEQRKAQ